MKRKGQPDERIPMRLPRVLWDILRFDVAPQKTASPFIAGLIQTRLIRDKPDDFQISHYPFPIEPCPSRPQISIRLTMKLNREFRKFCVDAGTNMTETIIEWLLREESVRAALKRHRYLQKGNETS